MNQCKSISVFKGDFHYRFDGKIGVLSHYSGQGVVLSSDDTNLCNKSDLHIEAMILQYKNELTEGV